MVAVLLQEARPASGGWKLRSCYRLASIRQKKMEKAKRPIETPDWLNGSCPGLFFARFFSSV